MAAAKSFPMIPGNVWWKLRDQFQKTMPGMVTRTYLATVLGVDEKTAGNIIGPLRTLGLVDKDGKPTERANHWRFDEDYASVCATIVEEVYPEELRHAVPDPKTNRDNAIRWFMRTSGVGEAGAKKMASTYQLLVEAKPKKVEVGAQPKTQRFRQARKSEAVSPAPSDSAAAATASAAPDTHSASIGDTRETADGVGPKIHIDINVHISSDASAEQIDQVFASMARHLYSKK